MILDRIENAAMYRPLGTNIARALDYLGRTDFADLAPGRYELDGDRVFALVSELELTAAAEAVWEAHRKYLDVQYVARGTERMGRASLRNDVRVTQPYDARTDAALYDVSGDLFTVGEGSFVIFTPQDIHAPGLLVEQAAAPQFVRKVVVKCRL